MSERGKSGIDAAMPEDAGASWRTLYHIATIAWLAILLGIVMQGLVLAGSLAGGGAFSQAGLLLGLAQGVTWSLFVCVGLGIATLLTKAHALATGLISMLFAPIALAVARSSQSVVASMVGAEGQAAVLSAGTISVLRALEYGLLGWLLALLVKRNKDRPLPYLGSGAAIGVIFGGAVVIVSYQVELAGGNPLALPRMIGMTVNEVAFPIGCALVIYMGLVVGRNLSAINTKAAA